MKKRKKEEKKEKEKKRNQAHDASHICVGAKGNGVGNLYFTSHSKQESATDMLDNLEKDFYDYKIVDNGEATTIKRLLY